jgi:tRNA(Ile)-lysidine synthetase-like protein
VERRYELLEVKEIAPLDPPGAAFLQWPVPGLIELPSGARLLAELRTPPRSALTRKRMRTAHATSLEIDASRVGSCLTVRRPQPGDRIQLRAGSRKLQDVFVDARIPKRERGSLAVVADGADILWVPGVVASVRAEAPSDLRAILELRVEADDCRVGGVVVKMQGFQVRFA